MADDPIFAFLSADFSRNSRSLSGVISIPRLVISFKIMPPEIDFRDTLFGEIVDSYGFTGAAHTDDGDDFYILESDFISEF